MSILEQLEKNSVWEVTELNTRETKFKDPIKDIIEGDNYKKHTFSSKEEAYNKADELKEKGIFTKIARTLKL